MTKKEFFKDRTVDEIKKLQVTEIHSPNGLVERIMDLDPVEDSLELRTCITPPQFLRGNDSGQRASRLNYKHGDFIRLSQPKIQRQAYACNDVPLGIRARDFSKLEFMPESEINFVGYTWTPVQGKDRRKRVVPFVWIPEAARLFAYAENMTSGIDVKPYPDAMKVKYEGADIVCKVPSRTRKRSRYKVRLKHVPVEGSTERRAVAYSIVTQYELGQCPEHETWNIRYRREKDPEASNVFTFQPHDIAAYMAVISHYTKQHNFSPLEMCPFALISQKEADFYQRICNNVMINDPTISRKDNLRKLHLDEKSILIARSIGVLGHENTMYADSARDGKIKDYVWK